MDNILCVEFQRYPLIFFDFLGWVGGVGVGVGVGAMGSANERRRYLQRILPLAEPIHTQVFPAVPTCDFVEGYLYASIYLY